MNLEEVLRHADDFDMPDFDAAIQKAERRLRIIDEAAERAERNLLLTDKLERLYSLSELVEPDPVRAQLEEAQSRLASICDPMGSVTSALAQAYRSPFEDINKACGSSILQQAQKALGGALSDGVLRSLEERFEATSQPWKHNSDLQDALSTIAGGALAFDRELEEARKMASGVIGRYEIEETLQRIAGLDQFENLELPHSELQRALQEAEVFDDGSIAVGDEVIEPEIVQHWARLLAAAANGIEDCQTRLQLLWIEVGERFGPAGQIILQLIFGHIVKLIIVSALCDLEEALPIEIPDWIADCECDAAAQTETGKSAIEVNAPKDE